MKFPNDTRHFHFATGSHLDMEIPLIIWTAGWLPRMFGVPDIARPWADKMSKRPFAPVKRPGFRVVVKAFTEVGLWWQDRNSSGHRRAPLLWVRMRTGGGTLSASA